MKYHARRNLRKKGFVSAYCSRGIESFMMEKVRLGKRNRKLTDHIFYPYNRKWDKVINPQSTCH